MSELTIKLIQIVCFSHDFQLFRTIIQLLDSLLITRQTAQLIRLGRKS